MSNLEEPSASRLDLAFAQFLGRRSGFEKARKSAFEKLLAQLSYEQTQGHSCMLVDIQAQELLLQSGLAKKMSPAHVESPALSTTTLPLIIEAERLYTQRYWFYEQRLAQQILQKTLIHYPLSNLNSALDRYFGVTSDAVDWQRAAAEMALQQAFTLITGGPGTGKTTTVVKILALMQEFSANPLHIALAAPTGKAAMRLQEAIGHHKSALPCSAAIKHAIPESVTTLHRLLGAKQNSPYFHHHAAKPLAYDLVVVDEASMIDLALLSKLVDALKPDARLILLGDKEQLASVESGAVLADLNAALPKHSLELKTSHRFEGAIKSLAEAINAQLPEQAWRVLTAPNTAVSLLNDQVIAYISEQQHPYLKLIKAGATYPEIYQAFMRFQVLFANRQGPNSVMDINYQVEQRLAQQNLIPLSGLWYSGRPILITQNNATLHLYNGDIGICLPDPEQPTKLKVFFERPDGSIKSYLPARITHCETVFAMTIHKSQGSEFEEVLVVLPDTLNPILTKELLYTAITRAKKTVKIQTRLEIFNATIRQKVQRVTGLMQKLNSLG
ncbi:MAG: exodeoxyribonuclease V subunit alpha [Methylococcaceae bacterium]|nr:exodeoxyribonuclease V subunit alpha [Methylococcaceae bacterium]